MEADKSCRQCGQELAAGKERPPAIHFGLRTFAYREGKRLVVSANACLPASCVKCGLPSSKVVGRTLSLATPDAWILLGVIMQQTMEMVVPLCESHWRRRRRLLWTGGLAVLASFPAFIALADFADSYGWGFLAWLLLFFGGLFLFDLDRNVLKPCYMDDNLAKLDGASEEFLSQLHSGPPAA